MRLYAQWPARRSTDRADPLAFFEWLQANHPYLTKYGVFGYRPPRQYISAITAKSKETYGLVERIGSKTANDQAGDASPR